MDNLIHNGYKRAIGTNNGATVMRKLDIVHSAAQLLVDAAKQYLEEGVHPRFICRCYRTALNLALKKINKIAVSIDGSERSILEKCAATTLRSKLVSDSREFFAKMIVDTVRKDIGVKLVKGGALQDSFFIPGVGFKRTFSYAGFEQQLKHFTKPKILLLNDELELKAEGKGAEVHVEDAKELQEIVDAEWTIIKRKLNDHLNSDANIVLLKKSIGDVATQFFADHDIFSAGRVPDEDMSRLSKCTCANILSTTSSIEEKNLGTWRFTGGKGRAAKQFFADHDNFSVGHIPDKDM